MTVRNLAGIGMVIVLVLLVTVGANPQKQNPTRQGKSLLDARLGCGLRLAHPRDARSRPILVPTGNSIPPKS